MIQIFARSLPSRVARCSFLNTSKISVFNQNHRAFKSSSYKEDGPPLPIKAQNSTKTTTWLICHLSKLPLPCPSHTACNWGSYAPYKYFQKDLRYLDSVYNFYVLRRIILFFLNYVNCTKNYKEIHADLIISCKVFINCLYRMNLFYLPRHNNSFKTFSKTYMVLITIVYE